MKNILKYTLSFAFVLLFTLYTFGQTGLSSHEENIIKVCLTETQAWLDVNYDAWVVNHTQHENETIIWTQPDGSVGSMVGWGAISTGMKNYMKDRAKDTAKLSGDNFKFIIQNNMAFVMYDQTLTAEDGKIYMSREHRTMIMKDGQWKIAAIMAFYDNSEAKK